MSNSFLQCVSNICGVELATLIGQYKFSVFGGHTVVVEGHNGIADYATDAVSFALHKSFLRVHGSNLCIKCLEKGFAVIVGNIHSVEVCDEKQL